MNRNFRTTFRGRARSFLWIVLVVVLLIMAGGCGKNNVLAPDYSEIMREVGSRYKDLYMAAQEDKWEFAEYQAIKIQLLIQKSAAVNPVAAKDTNDFLAGAYPLIVDAVKTKDKDQFEAGYGKLNAYCNTCHTSQNVGYLALTIPTGSDSPVLEGGAGGGGEKKPDEGGGGGDDKIKAEVEKVCSACHDLERIKTAAYTGDAWKALVDRMKGKGAGVADVDAFAAYLDKSKGLKEAGGGGGEGGGGGDDAIKAEVEKVCSACHDLERIKTAAYTGDAWKALVDRMKGKGAGVADVDAFAAYLDKSEGLKK